MNVFIEFRANDACHDGYDFDSKGAISSRRDSLYALTAAFEALWKAVFTSACEDRFKVAGAKGYLQNAKRG